MHRIACKQCPHDRWADVTFDLYWWALDAAVTHALEEPTHWPRAVEVAQPSLF
jgi:hypothetical protein